MTNELMADRGRVPEMMRWLLVSLLLHRKTIPVVTISRVFPVWTFKTAETHFSLCLKSSVHRQIGPRENVRTPTCYGNDLQQSQETIFVILWDEMNT